MTKEEILTKFGCPDIPFDEHVTMYYPAILSAMYEYAEQEVKTARKQWEPKWIPISDRLPEIDESTKTELGYYSKPVLCACDCWPRFCFVFDGKTMQYEKARQLIKRGLLLMPKTPSGKLELTELGRTINID